MRILWNFREKSIPYLSRSNCIVNVFFFFFLKTKNWILIEKWLFRNLEVRLIWFMVILYFDLLHLQEFSKSITVKVYYLKYPDTYCACCRCLGACAHASACCVLVCMRAYASACGSYAILVMLNAISQDAICYQEKYSSVWKYFHTFKWHIWFKYW